MSYTARSQWEGIRRLARVSIPDSAVSFTIIDTALSNPVRQIIVTNDTNAVIAFSVNNNGANFELLPYSQFVSDIAANKQTNGSLFMSKGDALYAGHVTAPTDGTGVSLAAMYGKGD